MSDCEHRWVDISAHGEELRHIMCMRCGVELAEPYGEDFTTEERALLANLEIVLERWPSAAISPQRTRQLILDWINRRDEE